jgi:hypothetical protein
MQYRTLPVKGIYNILYIWEEAYTFLLSSFIGPYPPFLSAGKASSDTQREERIRDKKYREPHWSHSLESPMEGHKLYLKPVCRDSSENNHCLVLIRSSLFLISSDKSRFEQYTVWDQLFIMTICSDRSCWELKGMLKPERTTEKQQWASYYLIPPRLYPFTPWEKLLDWQVYTYTSVRFLPPSKLTSSFLVCSLLFWKWN